MPVVLLERLPLPSLQTYTAVSLSMLACAVYYAKQVVEENQDSDISGQLFLAVGNESLKLGAEAGVSRNVFPPPLPPVSNEPSFNHIHPSDGMTWNIFAILLQEVWCIWTLINMAFCLLILLGKLVQKLVFGELRVSEQQHIKDRFWNFLFYKFIFIFGVINVQNMDEVFAWSAWFAVLGFLHLLSQLCKDRFEYLSFSPTTPTWQHAKVLSLLVVLEGCTLALAMLCVLVGLHAGLNTATFMLAECCLLAIKCLYVILRYAIHLWDLHHEGVWENRALYIYYSEFIFEMISLTIDFLHHLHMLLWGNIFLSMASLVICMQLRYLFHELQRRLRRHRNYCKVVNSMQARFPMAAAEELEENNDDCAICWDKMEVARKLPCGHLFHNSCLRSWLEQDTSCPTCRLSLSDPQEPGIHHPQQVPPTEAEETTHRPANNHFSNHFFHFDGSRYVSWLPSFSVEVTHTNMLGRPVNTVNPLQTTSLLDNMGRQVLSVFPNMPLNTVMDDLQVTRSVELTIENILEGRVQAPPTSYHQQATHMQSSGESQTGSLSAEESSSTFSSASSSAASTPSTSAPSFPSASFAAAAAAAAPEHHQCRLESIPPEQNLETHREQGEPVSAVAGFRFSKSSLERETMLASRKDTLMEQARRRFLAKRNRCPFPSCSSEEESVASTSSQIAGPSSTQRPSSQGKQQLDCRDDSESSGCDEDVIVSEPTSLFIGQSEDELRQRRDLLLRARQRHLHQS